MFADPKDASQDRHKKQEDRDQAFREFDADGDGSLSREEWGKGHAKKWDDTFDDNYAVSEPEDEEVAPPPTYKSPMQEQIMSLVDDPSLRGNSVALKAQTAPPVPEGSTTMSLAGKQAANQFARWEPPSGPVSNVPARPLNRRVALENCYREFDLDGSGAVGAEELLALGKARRKLGQVSGEWTEEMNTQMMQDMGANENGQVTMQDFVQFFDKKLPQVHGPHH